MPGAEHSYGTAERESAQLRAPLLLGSLSPGLRLSGPPPIACTGPSSLTLWATRSGVFLCRERVRGTVTLELEAESGRDTHGGLLSLFTPCPRKGLAAPEREYGFVPKDRRWQAPALISA